MQNFDRVLEATNASLLSDGATIKQNEEYTKGLEYAVSQLKSQFNELVIGEGGLQSFAKSLINLGTGTLSLVNNIGGLKTIIIALMGLGISASMKKFIDLGMNTNNVIIKLIGRLAELQSQLVVAKANGDGLSVALKGVYTSAELAQMAVLGLTAVITAGVAIYSAWKRAEEEATQGALERSQEMVEKTKNLNEETENYSKNLNLENKSLDDLKENLAEINSKYVDEVNQISDVNEQRERAIELLEQEAQKRANANKNNVVSDLFDTNFKDIQSANAKLGKATFISSMSQGSYSETTGQVDPLIQQAENAMKAAQGYDEVIAKSNKYIQSLRDARSELEFGSEEYNNYTERISNALSGQQEFIDKYADQESIIENNKIAFAQLGYVIKENADGELEYAENKEEATRVLNEAQKGTAAELEAQLELQEAYNITDDDIQQYIESHEGVEEAAEQAGQSIDAYVVEKLAEERSSISETSNALQTFVDYVSNVSDAYGVLSNAVEEYNTTGGYSLETLNKLIPLMGRYGQMFDIVDGQINIHTEDMYSLIEAEAEEQKSVIRGTAIAKLNALEQENSGKSAKESGDKHKDATAGIDENTASLNENTEAAVKNAQAQALQRGASKDDVENIVKEMQANIDLIDKAVAGMNTSFADSSKKAAKRASGSHKSSAKESKDAWLEAYKTEKDALESLYKTNVITAEEYATKLRELSDKYLTDTADHQKKYAKEIHDAYEAMYTALKKSAKEALDEEEKRLKKVYDDTKDQKSKALKDLKKVHEEEEKAIKREIDALKKEKDAIKDGYDARIKALKSEREEYERQVKLMQLKEELAKAKATRQYVMDETGRFTYQEDSEAVDQAREDLIEEESKQAYERELNALEEARDNAVKIYEERIQALEDHYDAVKEQNDQAEEDLEAHYDAMLEQYERSYNDFKENADKYLNGQMQLTNNENTEWGRRLTNLANFVNEYNRLMNSLNNGSTDNSSNYKGTPSSNNSIKGSSSKSSTKGTKTTFYNAKTGKQVLKPHYQKIVSGTRASGDASISSDGMYLIGDSPNKELVIGSKLNGVPLSLSRGDGVVNAKSTNTLAGILNMIGGIAKPLAPNQTTNNSTSNITISNVSLPNVHNGEEFINCLQHFDIDMMQRSYDTY